MQLTTLLLILFVTICHSFTIAAEPSSDTQVSQDVQDGILKLNVDLLKKLYTCKNLVFSLISIYPALAELELGTYGETQSQIKNVMGISTEKYSTEEVHSTIGDLLKIIQNSRPPNIIKMANGIFVQLSVILRKEFTSNVTKYYDAEMKQLDFQNNPDGSTDTINDFVSDQTNGLIPKLFTQPLGRDTVIVLVESIYFKANWSERFTEIKNGTFWTGCENVTVSVMHKMAWLQYTDSGELNAQAISLPYEGNNISMIFVLPHQNYQLKQLVNDLTPSKIKTLINELEGSTEYVHMQIPRTENEWSSSLNEPLKNLGMPKVFNETAEINITETNYPLAVSEIKHAAKIRINENGTEASAVTGVTITYRSSPLPTPQPIDFNLNKPFLYCIYDSGEKLILFIGMVHNPNGNEE